MKISVIGCGRWGSFIAWYLHHCGHEVCLYGRPGSQNLERLRQTRTNDYLIMPDAVHLTNDLEEAAQAKVIVISVASRALAAQCRQLTELGVKDRVFVLCMKGLEQGTGRRLSQVAGSDLDASNRVAVWLGPGHVQEFVRMVPNCMVIDSADEQLKHELVSTLSSDLIRFYYGADLIGNEIGAAAKNVIGIAAGFLDGVGRTTLKGALMSRGTREIARLITALGGDGRSAYGLCHLGDYEATVFSEHSHNRRFGECFVRGEAFDKLAEGYYTASDICALACRNGVELPICEAVYDILYHQAEPMQVFDRLFARSLKQEF